MTHYLAFDIYPPLRRRRSRIIGLQGWMAMAGFSMLIGAVLAFVL